MLSYKNMHNLRMDLVVLLCILIPSLTGYYYFPVLPEKVATHWNLHGEVNGWMSKKYMVIGLMQAIQLFLYGMMEGLRWLILQISHTKERDIQPAVKIFREKEMLITVGLVDRIMLLSIGLLGSAHIFIIFHAVYGTEITIFTFFLLPLFLASIFAMIIFAIRKINRMRRELASQGNLPAELSGENDRYWKWGVIYMNPNDKALFVRQRIGIGYTLNFSRRTSWAIVLMILLPQIIILGVILSR